MWSFKRQVNYYETDRMGVVHHSNYLRYLEEARYVWMEEMGLPYPEFERQGVIILRFQYVKEPMRKVRTKKRIFKLILGKNIKNLQITKNPFVPACLLKCCKPC